MDNHPMVASDVLASRSARTKSRRAVQVMIFPGVSSLLIDTMQFPLKFAEGDVQDLNREGIAILEDLRRDVQRYGVDLSQHEHNYLRRLRDHGKAAYNAVLPPAARDFLAELEEHESERGRGLGLTFKTPATFPLIWEMLYSGEPGNAEFGRFWGFRYPMGRTFWQIQAPDRIRLQDGTFSAIHEELQSSRHEVQSLGQFLSELGQILGRTLTARLLDEVITPEALSVERLIELLHDNDFRYGLVHFACHCENPADSGALRSRLRFTAHGGAMDLCLSKLLVWQECGFMHQPFVFLNACESATLGHQQGMLSFPTEVLNFGAGGVIAAACALPDNFASAFAAEFYRRLLEKPVDKGSTNIGETLLETRLHFLECFNNPLGLAYGLYAISDQRLDLQD